jgi:hypothetical protein
MYRRFHALSPFALMETLRFGDGNATTTAKANSFK